MNTHTTITDRPTGPVTADTADGTAVLITAGRLTGETAVIVRTTGRMATVRLTNGDTAVIRHGSAVALLDTADTADTAGPVVRSVTYVTERTSIRRTVSFTDPARPLSILTDRDHGDLLRNAMAETRGDEESAREHYGDTIARMGRDAASYLTEGGPMRDTVRILLDLSGPTDDRAGAIAAYRYRIRSAIARETRARTMTITERTADRDAARDAAYAADGPVNRPDRDTGAGWAIHAARRGAIMGPITDGRWVRRTDGPGRVSHDTGDMTRAATVAARSFRDRSAGIRRPDDLTIGARPSDPMSKCIVRIVREQSLDTMTSTDLRLHRTFTPSDTVVREVLSADLSDRLRNLAPADYRGEWSDRIRDAVAASGRTFGELLIEHYRTSIDRQRSVIEHRHDDADERAMDADALRAKRTAETSRIDWTALARTIGLIGRDDAASPVVIRALQKSARRALDPNGTRVTIAPAGTRIPTGTVSRMVARD